MKIEIYQWITIILTIILVCLIALLGLIIGFNKIFFYILVIAILLALYVLSYLFEPQLFEYGETQIKWNDEEILKLEKDNCALIWAFTNGAGIAFILTGLPKIAQSPLEAGIGLTLLIIGNLIYNYAYRPRYALLIRKRKINLGLSKNKIL